MLRHKLVYLAIIIMLAFSLLVGCGTPAIPVAPTQASAAPTVASAAPAPTSASAATASNASAKPSSTSAPATAYRPVKLRFHSFTPPPPSLHGVAAQWFMDEVTKRSNGAVTWDPFWSGTLADGAGQLDLVAKGAIDVQLSSSLFWPAKFPIGHFDYAFPFNPEDPTLLVKSFNQIKKEFPQFNAEWEKQNVVWLTNLVAPYYDVITKKPVNKVEDLKGTKMAAAGKYLGRWFQPTGVTVVSLGLGDFYPSLQSGVVDGICTVIDAQYSVKLQEIAKYELQAGLGSFSAPDLMMNSSAYQKLEPGVQKIIVEVANEAPLYIAEVFKAKRSEIIEAMKKEGVTITTLSESERARWIELAPDTPAEWATDATKAGAPGWDIAKRWQEITTSMGHKWPRQWAVKR